MFIRGLSIQLAKISTLNNRYKKFSQVLGSKKILDIRYSRCDWIGLHHIFKRPTSFSPVNSLSIVSISPLFPPPAIIPPGFPLKLSLYWFPLPSITSYYRHVDQICAGVLTSLLHLCRKCTMPYLLSTLARLAH